MTKLRIVMAMGLMTLVSARAYAADEGAWNTKYGMLFSVQNVFQNGNESIIGDFGGGVGVQYNLSETRAMRFSVNLSRASHDAFERESTDLTTGTVTTTFVAPTDFTSQYVTNAAASYVMRLTSASVAPYLGAGAGFRYTQTAMNWENSTGAASVISRDDMDRTLALTMSGTLGLEWRVHRAISLFAEYGLGLDLVSWHSDTDETRTVSKTTGQTTSGTKSEGSSTTFFNFRTGLGQGGQIGVVAFF